LIPAKPLPFAKRMDFIKKIKNYKLVKWIIDFYLLKNKIK
jgi:hypothetical protein